VDIDKAADALHRMIKTEGRASTGARAKNSADHRKRQAPRKPSRT